MRPGTPCWPNCQLLQERDALATAELQQHLNAFSDPEVSQRVRHTEPWHRDVVEALAQSDAAA